MSARPNPPLTRPKGHHYEAVEADPRWRALAVRPDWTRRCRGGAGYRKPACGQPAVAEFRRSHGNDYRWWAYCAEHLYGKWIEGGRVMHWVLRADRAEVGGAS